MTSAHTRRHGPADLSAGAHLSPAEGTCLMEAVSVAAQLPWSDSPPCTHPLLAHLARLVNDSVSDRGRRRLAVLVPDLRSAHPATPTDAGYVSARIATTCTARALRIHPSLLLVFLHHSACAALERERRLRSPDPEAAHGPGAGAAPDVLTKVRRGLFGRGPAMRAVEAAVAACCHLDEGDRDRALVGMLEEALSVGRAEQQPPVRVA
jgi:hypothetical protein